MPFPLAAAIVAGSVISGVGSYLGGRRQARAGERAAELAGQQYGQTREDLMPWQEAGLTSLEKLKALLGFEGQGAADQAFTESPAYRFNLEQGMEAINKGAAARGNFYAPATLRDLGKYAQGTASNEFQNVYNRLFGLSEAGRGAAVQSGQLGVQSAGQQGEAIMGAGNARAAGTVGVTNALTGGLSDAYNAYLLSTVLGSQPTVAPRGNFSYSG